MSSRTRLTAPLVAALLLLVGCGGADHSEADVAFAQHMVPHHEQAVEMADQALAKSEDPDVRDLAEQIKDAQDPEIDQMTGWLQEWGEDAPAGDHGSDHGDDHASDMPGMMTSEDMDALAQASGEAFDRLWLEQMVRHHEGAIEMAQQEVEQGDFEPARDLAVDIARSQRAELEQMRAMLAA